MALVGEDDTFFKRSLLADLPGQAHVWLAHCEIAHSEVRRAYYESLLSSDEWRRYRRFHFEHDRVMYLVAHALVRTTLSRYTDVAPEHWSFRANRYGRPEVDTDSGRPPLRFNLSHAPGLVACVVTVSVDCGVDIENVREVENLMGLARRILAKRELEAFETLPIDCRTSRFFEYWTLKESYIKARGMGLSLPLGQFSFRFDGTRLSGFEIAPSLNDDPAAWQFSVCATSDSYKLAVALRRGTGPDMPIVYRFVEP